jgi:hypothetical protein
MNKIAVRPFATLKLSFFALAGVALLLSAGKSQLSEHKNQPAKVALVHSAEADCARN